MNAKEAFDKIAWETDTSQIHGITGENMLVNDVRAEECNIVHAALTELEEIKKRAIPMKIKNVKTIIVHHNMFDTFDTTEDISGNCPICEWRVDRTTTMGYTQKFCPNCGQALDFIIKGESK